MGIRFIIKSRTFVHVVQMLSASGRPGLVLPTDISVFHAPRIKDRSCSDKIYLNLSGNLYSHCYSKDKASTSPSNGQLTLIRRGSFLRVLLYHVCASETTFCLCTVKTSACLVHSSITNWLNLFERTKKTGSK
jgi:hypothetical protein